MLQQITLGGAMIALPIFLQMTLEYNAMQAGLSLAPLSLSMFAVACSPASAPGSADASDVVLVGLRAQHARHGRAHSHRAPRRLRLGAALPLLIVGSGLGLLVSQLNNYTLCPIEEERVERGGRA